MIVDEQQLEGDFSETNDLDNEIAEIEAEKSGPSYEVPEKFKGKSKEEIAQAFENLEKELGRKNNEVGDLRRYADQLLELKEKQLSEPEPEEEIDFFDDPKKAVEQTVNPRIQKLERELESQKLEKARNAFESKHPDYMDVAKSNEFQDWVRNSQYRINQFQAANQYDYSAADALLSEWKDRKAALEKVTEQKREKRDNDLKAASSESSSSHGTSRKIYRRSDLMRMKIEDPETYNARMPEIMKAYAEGRVR